MKILEWNSRGAASKSFAAVLRDMKRRYRLDLVVILEPRISGNPASKVIKSWGFKHSVRMEAVGFSGGIWLLWELDELVVDVKIMDEQFIHCQLSLGDEVMLFTAVYAHPNEQRRNRIWDILHRLACEIEEPWMLVGDFNEIRSPLEQKGGGRINEVRCNKFNQWIEDCNFIDVEASGPLFTWKGPKWEGLERVYKRLDSSTSFDRAEARNVKYEEFSAESKGSSSSSESTIEVCGTLASGSHPTCFLPTPPPASPPYTIGESSSVSTFEVCGTLASGSHPTCEHPKPPPPPPYTIGESSSVSTFEVCGTLASGSHPTCEHPKPPPPPPYTVAESSGGHLHHGRHKHGAPSPSPSSSPAPSPTV
ncbi:hypothetical protein K1719_001828 [Acacia pycnantha]|nr:hypothetical protein K1719_001828 [Acacia pycnantha]